MRIGLIELIELYDKAIFKPLHFANYFTHISTVYTCVENFTCLIWFGVALGVAVFQVLCFLCSLNQGFFSYNKYNLSGIAIKTVL